MIRPNKDDYDFNNTIDGAMFAVLMNKYADWLEKQIKHPVPSCPECGSDNIRIETIRCLDCNNYSFI